MTVDKLYIELMKLKRKGKSASDIVFVSPGQLKTGDTLRLENITEETNYIILSE